MNTYNDNRITLSVSDFQHSADKIAIDAVQKIPGFQKMIEFISKNSLEKVYRFQFLSSNIQITEKMMPRLHKIIDEGCKIFGIKEKPPIYLLREYSPGVLLEGVKNPFLVVTTAMLEEFDDDMLWCTIASQLAGIPAGHAEIKFVGKMLNLIGSQISPSVATALDLPVKNWYRKRTLTLDRAALLVTGDFELAAKSILIDAVPFDALKTFDFTSPNNPYLIQAREFVKRNGVDGVIQKAVTVFSNEEWLATRYIELYNWYNNGEYDIIRERSENNV